MCMYYSSPRLGLRYECSSVRVCGREGEARLQRLKVRKVDGPPFP